MVQGPSIFRNISKVYIKKSKKKSEKIEIKRIIYVHSYM
jgi:hypothetical protein